MADAPKKRASRAAREDADLFGAPAPAPQRPSPAAEDHRHGHRQRLRARFMQGGLAALQDYELLELVLFRAVPRRDVKPLAKRLLTRFESVAGVFAASPERLREIDGLGDAAIVELKIVEAAARRMAQVEALARPEMTSFDAVVGYCRVVMGRASAEEFRVFFLDRKNRLIADEVLNRGTVDQVAVYPRDVATRALELRASAVIMAHNHPSGDPTPSKADVEMTKRVAKALKAVEIELLDHVVVGAADAESLRGLGHL